MSMKTGIGRDFNSRISPFEASRASTHASLSEASTSPKIDRHATWPTCFVCASLHHPKSTTRIDFGADHGVGGVNVCSSDIESYFAALRDIRFEQTCNEY